ncbi:MAG: hypothetical protein ABF381_06890, partial [Akkermansiaceae bacterium]
YFDQSECYSGAQRLAATGVITNRWQHFLSQRDTAGSMEIWIDGTAFLFLRCHKKYFLIIFRVSRPGSILLQ